MNMRPNSSFVRLPPSEVMNDPDEGLYNNQSNNNGSQNGMGVIVKLDQ
jgi:hypothetical protein